MIPVIDLRHGRVVRARAGERDSYAPIETPLAKGSAPAEIARGLDAACPGAVLYVADLDAIIDRAPPDRAALAAIAQACPGRTLWVDAGFADAAGVDAFLASGLGRPVIGSESQSDSALIARLGTRAILSLDSRGAERLGPDALHDEARHWPPEIIAMTLTRIGAGAGPDLAALAELRARAPQADLYAAGGVRDVADLVTLRDAGVAGALVASALHDGTLSLPGLRDFLQKLPAHGAD